MPTKHLYLVSGPSGVGKSTVVSILENKYGYKRLVSCTDRPKRMGETSEYHFLSPEEFSQKTDIVAETTFSGHRYGAALSDIQGASIYICDLNGVKDMREALAGERMVFSFGLTVGSGELRSRMRRRGDSEAAVTTRIAHDTKAFRGMGAIVDALVSAIDAEATAAFIHEYIQFCEK